MSKKSTGKGKAASSVNPQGKSPDAEFGMEPKTELENRAKKKNTRI
ncbi:MULTISPECIES: small, acid-soluble spore protein L [Fictibacillus]